MLSTAIKKGKFMKRTKSERGQSLVELSISLMVMLMLLVGAAEFGVALFQFIQLRDAAQEGALYGSLYPDDTSGIKSRIRYVSDTPLDLTDTAVLPDAYITITTKNSAGGAIASSAACPGGEITVELKYDHIIFLPFAKMFTGGATKITLTASVSDTILIKASSATC